MVKPQQIGKLHNYPSQRKSYSCSRAGIGGPKAKKKSSSTSNVPTYFDLLKNRQTKGKYILYTIFVFRTEGTFLLLTR